MKVAVLNGGVFGSTGAIIAGVMKTAEQENADIQFWVSSPVTATNRKAQPAFEYDRIGSYFSRRVSVLLARLTGYNGCFALIATLRYLSRLKKFAPDLIHIHTLHNSYINLPLLWAFIKKRHIPVVWTLHDCWAFTGQCPHYAMVHCEKWKTGCGGCPQVRAYPAACFDRTRRMFRKKENMFTGVEDLQIVTPSCWLMEQVKASFLKEYPVTVINNGIDPEVFRPCDPSVVREKYPISPEKRIILGVAFGWNDRKGLDVFVDLAGRLDSDKVQIILVGTDENVDRQLPETILSIHRTDSRDELAQIYSVADVFVNPTREDTFPTVNIEALACGTPVITFETGGSTEAPDATCGIVVPLDDIEGIVCAIESLGEKTPDMQEACVNRSKAFLSKDKYHDYLQMYQRVNERVTKS